MSNHIPRARRWRAKFYCDRIMLADITVEAPTRLFARWAARDRLRAVHFDRYLASNIETISPIRNRGV